MFERGRREEALHAIPAKATVVLQVVLCLFLLLALRIWHLAVIQHEKNREEGFRSRKRQVIDPPARGTIRDRYNILLAGNRVAYRLAIVYAQFRDIPSVIVEKDGSGVKTRRFLRKEYIRNLSIVLAKELEEPAERIEDIIYSHAALNGTIPFVIQEELTEKQYYRLKMLEKDWVGIQAERVAKRYYPKGRLAADVIGYLAPISRSRYLDLVGQISQLETTIHTKSSDPEDADAIDAAKKRLFALKERVYTINDQVGIQGIEASFQEDLRGFVGRRRYFSDAKGNALRSLSGSYAPTPGKRVLLTISSELQEYAEQLLAQSEADREENRNAARTRQRKGKEPYVRGGAIVAMDPHTGEILALASFPRFDPNDFVRAKASLFGKRDDQAVLRWLEHPQFIGRMWDKMTPLRRERYSDAHGEFVDEEEWLSWDRFLDLTLPYGSPIADLLDARTSVKEIISLQRAFFEAQKRAPDLTPAACIDALYPDHECIQDIVWQGPPFPRGVLDSWMAGIPANRDKLLLLDLSRLVVRHEEWSPELIDRFGDLSIAALRDMSSAYVRCAEDAAREMRRYFHCTQFASWRKEHEGAFLKGMRLEEKAQGRYARPYLDYLDKEEAAQFCPFWQRIRLRCIMRLLNDPAITDEGGRWMPLRAAHQGLDERRSCEFLSALKGYDELTHPLLGEYRFLKKERPPMGKDLAGAFSRFLGPGPTASLAYRVPAIQGSIFKLITAYALLKQRYKDLGDAVRSSDLGLFEITDTTFTQQGRTYVGYFADGKVIPQLYKGGRIPKSLSPRLGRMGLLRAIETSSNPYFALAAGEHLHDPNDLARAAIDFGYGEKSGVELPGECRGGVPRDLATNRTGLYATAIGQHTLIATPLQSATMLSAIANGGTLLRPKVVRMVVGKGPIGDMASTEVSLVPTEVRRELFFPAGIRNTLLEGMRSALQRIGRDAYQLSPIFLRHPEWQRPFRDLRFQLVGKSSTSEALERIGIGSNPAVLYSHVWFGAISFGAELPAHTTPSTFLCSDAFGRPELVVVVYLRYGHYGKEEAPIATAMVEKWREIRARHAPLPKGIMANH